MKKNCIYKIKPASKKLFLNSKISSYVLVIDFATNPINPDDKLFCIFKYINIKDMEFVEDMYGSFIISCKEFEKHFDLYKNTQLIDKKLLERGEQNGEETKK